MDLNCEEESCGSEEDGRKWREWKGRTRRTKNGRGMGQLMIKSEGGRNRWVNEGRK